MNFVCPACGEFSKLTAFDAEMLDSGTEITCSECKSTVVVDLNTPEQRSKLWREFKPEWFRERHQGYKPAVYSGTVAQEDSTL